jgi:hypothetical protein
MLENYYDKIIAFCIKYKWFILPGIFIIVILYTVFSVTPNHPSTNILKKTTTPTSEVVQVNTNIPIPTGTVATKELIQIDGKSRPELISKKNIENNLVQYEYSSDLNTRPNILITKDGSPVFQRTISNTDYPVPLSYYSKYGQPDVVIQGSRYYGEKAETYILASKGITYIVNPDSLTVNEVQLYPQMTVVDYIAIYGQDITNKANIIHRIVPSPATPISEEND